MNRCRCGNVLTERERLAYGDRCEDCYAGSPYGVRGAGPADVKEDSQTAKDRERQERLDAEEDKLCD